MRREAVPGAVPRHEGDRSAGQRADVTGSLGGAVRACRSTCSTRVVEQGVEAGTADDPDRSAVAPWRVTVAGARTTPMRRSARPGPIRARSAAWTASTTTTTTSRSARRSAPSSTRSVVPNYLDWERAGITPREVFVEAGRSGFLGMAVPEQYGGGGVEDFRFNQILAEQVALRRASAAPGSGLTLHNDICLPYFLAYTHRGAEAALAARHRVRRADHRGRHDRARRRLGPGRHAHQRQARRRQLRRQRVRRRSSPTASTPTW